MAELPEATYKLTVELGVAEQSVAYAIERLLKAGFISETSAPAQSEQQLRGGRARRWFVISPEGRRFLVELDSSAA